MARRPKTAKLAADERLRHYVQDRLAGQVRRPGGAAVPGPATRAWKGRNKPRRQDRKWATAWSPEQIANRLKIEFPDDESMRISHEAIYQALYVQSRGALKRELVACLRTGRALRVPRARARARGKGFVSKEIMISERPAEAADRAVPGHWEGDLILGTDRSAIGTLVERTSRFVMLLHLPPDQDRAAPRIKNGPPVSGHGAEQVRDAIAAAIVTLPEQLRRSLTWDQGAEMAQHAELRIDTGSAGLLLRPAEPLAARHQREHQRPLASVLPEGHRPRAPQRLRPRRRSRHPERQAAQDARLAHPCRGPRRAPRCGPLRPARGRSKCGAAPGNPLWGGGRSRGCRRYGRPPGEPSRRQPRDTLQPEL